MRSTRNVVLDSGADRRFYESTGTDSISDDNIASVIERIRAYYQKYQSILVERFARREGIRALELGAGTCCLSLLISNLPFIRDVHCLDVSSRKMAKLLPLSTRQIPCKAEKLKLVEGNFGEELNFEDAYFDLVLLDASLHHTRSMWRTLSECRRVLKSDGLLIAQREQYLGILTFGIKLNHLLKSEEVRSGVSESAYLRKQYEYYFKACGFDVRFLPVAESFLQRLLSPLNGWVYSKWVILASKKAAHLS